MVAALHFGGPVLPRIDCCTGFYIIMDVWLNLSCHQGIAIIHFIDKPLKHFHAFIEGTAVFEFVDGKGELVQGVDLLNRHRFSFAVFG